MKLSSDRREGELSFWRRWRWWLGFFLLVVNATAIDLIAYGITPLSLIAPFAGLTIVFSSLLAATGCLIEREVPSARGAMATLLVLTGVTIVSVFAPHGDGSPDTPHLSTASIAFTAASAGYTFAWLLISRLGSVDAAAPICTLAASLASACCGMITQVAIKQISMAVVSSLQASAFIGWRNPTLWAALAAVPFSAPLQLWLLNGTLAAARVGYAVPTYQSLLILMTTAAAGLIFGEFDDVTPTQMAWFAGGVGCAIVGLAILTATPQDASEGLSTSLLDGVRIYSEALPTSPPHTPPSGAPAPPSGIPGPAAPAARGHRGGEPRPTAGGGRRGEYTAGVDLERDGSSHGASPASASPLARHVAHLPSHTGLASLPSPQTRPTPSTPRPHAQ